MMDTATLNGTVTPGVALKRWSASELFASGANSPPGGPARPLARSTSATRVRISPASSTPTSRAPSPVPSPGHAPPFSPPTPRVPRVSTLPRRLSKPLISFASTLGTPAPYLSFFHLLRRQHPSLLFFFLVAVSAVLSNKALLRGFFHGLTYALTAWQMACASLGTMLGERIGAYKPSSVAKRHDRLLLLCALVFSLEILASNLALRMVLVSFHVSVRACAPILTLLLSLAFFGQRTTLRTTASLLPLLLGAFLAARREALTSTGPLFLFASMVLLSAKSLLVTHFLQGRLGLTPIDILARLAPLSMAHSVLFAVVNGEVSGFWRFVTSDECTKMHLAEIVLNGVLSFALVPLGLVAERKTRAPAHAITTHAAQATTILISLLVPQFGLRLAPLNFIGVALTFVGGVMYAKYDAQDLEEREGVGGEGELPVRREKRAPD